MGSFGGLGLSDPLLEVEVDVYQCHCVNVWVFCVLNDYQVGRDVDEAVVIDLSHPSIAEKIDMGNSARVQEFCAFLLISVVTRAYVCNRW